MHVAAAKVWGLDISYVKFGPMVLSSGGDRLTKRMQACD